MDPETRQIYDRHADDWIGNRHPVAVEDGRLDRFAARVASGGHIADLGAGPGWYAAAFRERGFRAVALDLSQSMLTRARELYPDLPCVCGDLARLPFARESLAGAFAINTYCHVPQAQIPVALAHLHASLANGAEVELTLSRLDSFAPEGYQGDEIELRGDQDFPGRLFSAFSPERAVALMEGAGFADIECEPAGHWLHVRARRARRLPDYLRPDLRLLVCGLNPSLYAADCGVPFGRPGNRFWPAAIGAGLVTARDPFHALERGVGFTDLVKRATPRASELELEEYRSGVTRVEALVRACGPRVVCFVGLEGWRRAVDRNAKPGWLEAGFAGTRAYLMPSTSGLNTHSTPADLRAHLERASG